nr:hypothetical protein [Vandammella animalimorsus]
MLIVAHWQAFAWRAFNRLLAAPLLARRKPALTAHLAGRLAEMGAKGGAEVRRAAEAQTLGRQGDGQALVQHHVPAAQQATLAQPAKGRGTQLAAKGRA